MQAKMVLTNDDTAVLPLRMESCSPSAPSLYSLPESAETSRMYHTTSAPSPPPPSSSSATPTITSNRWLRYLKLAAAALVLAIAWQFIHDQVSFLCYDCDLLLFTSPSLWLKGIDVLATFLFTGVGYGLVLGIECLLSGLGAAVVGVINPLAHLLFTPFLLFYGVLCAMDTSSLENGRPSVFIFFYGGGMGCILWLMFQVALWSQENFRTSPNGGETDLHKPNSCFRAVKESLVQRPFFNGTNEPWLYPLLFSLDVCPSFPFLPILFRSISQPFLLFSFQACWLKKKPEKKKLAQKARHKIDETKREKNAPTRNRTGDTGTTNPCDANFTIGAYVDNMVFK